MMDKTFIPINRDFSVPALRLWLVVLQRRVDDVVFLEREIFVRLVVDFFYLVERWFYAGVEVLLHLLLSFSVLFYLLFPHVYIQAGLDFYLVKVSLDVFRIRKLCQKCLSTIHRCFTILNFLSIFVFVLGYLFREVARFGKKPPT